MEQIVAEAKTKNADETGETAIAEPGEAPAVKKTLATLPATFTRETGTPEASPSMVQGPGFG